MSMIRNQSGRILLPRADERISHPKEAALVSAEIGRLERLVEYNTFCGYENTTTERLLAQRQSQLATYESMLSAMWELFGDD